MRPFLVSTCLVTAIFTGAAFAQSPVAYVYVGETSGNTTAEGPFSPITTYAASSDGKLTEIKGSPFTQFGNTGVMIGTNGTHFIVAGPQPNLGGDGPFTYLYSYEVGSNGAIGQQVSVINTASYGGADCSLAEQPAAEAAVLDHTGQYIYVNYCSDAIQTYKIAHSGALTFQGATTYSNSGEGGAPKIAGNDTFAYNMRVIQQIYSYGTGLNVFARESDGSLENRGEATVIGPSLPKDYYYSFAPGGANYYQGFNYPVAEITNDSTNHFAAALIIEKFIPPDTSANEGCAFASFTVGSQGELISTNTYDNMPKLVGCGNGMLLSPSGKTLAVNGANALEFYHFNGSASLTPLGEIVSKSGSFGTMAWDNSDHLYALNSLSGRLHVYTVSSTNVVEAPGSPYDVPFCGYDMPDSTLECPQTLVVRIVP
ncbi:MAG: hypothetical protein WBE76_05790 [Terracidiphilus sp.]